MIKIDFFFKTLHYLRYLDCNFTKFLEVKLFAFAYRASDWASHRTLVIPDYALIVLDCNFYASPNLNFVTECSLYGIPSLINAAHGTGQMDCHSLLFSTIHNGWKESVLFLEKVYDSDKKQNSEKHFLSPKTLSLKHIMIFNHSDYKRYNMSV